MFRSVSSERHLSGGQSSPSAAGPGVTSPGLDSQESSWIGLLSVFSRPAWSFLQKYLPGRPRTPGLSEDRAAWMSGDLNPGKTMFVDEEREFLRQLDDMMPLTQHAAPHLTYLRCQQDGVAGLMEQKGGGSLPWLTADSLREIGIQSAEDVDINLVQQTQMGHLSSIRTFLSHVWLSSVSSQEIKPAVGTDWVSQSSGGNKSRTWWGSFWGGEESSQRGLLLSDLAWAEDGTGTGRLCPQQPAADTKAAQTAAVFVQSVGGGSRGWTLGENTGPSDHKDELDHNGGLHLVQNTEGSSSDRRLSITNHLNASGAATAAACSEVTLLTPDQDNGYSSLEEEHVHMCRLFMVNAPRDPPPPQAAEPAGTRAAGGTDMEEKTSDDAESTSGNIDEEEEEDEEAAALEDQCSAAAVAEEEEAVSATPQCQNKAIAFIMGCPCSDDDSSQSDSDSSDDDDDGFDSEGSSDLSDSTDEDNEDDEDDEDSDGEVDSEAERLWSSLCQSQDPYNPRNFTARLHTSSTPPKTIPASTPPSSAQSSPASSPDVNPLPVPSSSSSPSGLEVWDDSTSASEADEAESLRLWSSFSCSSDPYSPFNFQAPLRTRGPVEAGPRARARAKKASQTPPRSPRHAPTSPPEYRKEEAEERLDSGFSEPFASCSASCSASSSTRSCSSTKKVRFCDDVEEFFASCGEEEEDRRGPWEEFARDRCRFLRRCQEVEQSIAYCLQPQHRRLVYHRLTVLNVQDV